MFSSSEYTFSFYAIPPFITSVAVLVFGLAVLVYERFSLVGRLFLFMTFSAATWLFGFSISYLASMEETALWWIKVGYIGVTFIPVGVYHFTVGVLQIDQKVRWSVRLCYAISTLFLILVFTSTQFIMGVKSYRWGLSPLLGWIGYPFILYFLIVMAVLFRYYFREYQKTDQETNRRIRIRNMMVALAIAYIGSLDFLVAFDIPSYPFGYLPILVFVIISAFTIGRYRLVDITPAFAAGKIINTMKDALFVFDRKGLIKVANRAAEELFGFPLKELKDRPLSALIDMSLSGDNSENPSKSEDIQNYEALFIDKENSRRTLSISTAGMYDQHRQLVATVCIARDISDIKKAEQELRRHRDHLEELVRARTAELTESRERLREEIRHRQDLVKELHDNIGNDLTSIKFLSEVIEKSLLRSPESVREHVKSIKEIATGSMEQLRAFVWALDPEESTFDDLLLQLRSYSGRLLDPLEIGFDFRVNISSPPPHLDINVLFNLMNIYKECMINIIKHSGAKRVMVEVCVDKEAIAMTIEDDGGGFDMDSVGGNCYGLKNMRRRAADIGAHFEIHSAEGEGSRVHLRLHAV
jgi:PAS domain S-box-containing protein